MTLKSPPRLASPANTPRTSLSCAEGTGSTLGAGPKAAWLTRLRRPTKCLWVWLTYLVSVVQHMVNQGSKTWPIPIQTDTGVPKHHKSVSYCTYVSMLCETGIS